MKVEGLPGIDAPQTFSVPSTACVDDIKACVVDRVWQLTGQRIFRSAFCLVQDGVHRPFSAPVSEATSAKFIFRWSQP